MKISSLTFFAGIVGLAGSVIVALSSFGYAQLPGAADPISAYEQEPEKDTKTEISAKELPKKVRMDIIEDYHAAEILQAWKTSRNGKPTGYMVEIKKGPKKWTVQYDTEGNPENKINPIN